MTTSQFRPSPHPHPHPPQHPARPTIPCRLFAPTLKLPPPPPQNEASPLQQPNPCLYGNAGPRPIQSLWSKGLSMRCKPTFHSTTWNDADYDRLPSVIRMMCYSCADLVISRRTVANVENEAGAIDNVGMSFLLRYVRSDFPTIFQTNNGFIALLKGLRERLGCPSSSRNPWPCSPPRHRTRRLPGLVRLEWKIPWAFRRGGCKGNPGKRERRVGLPSQRWNLGWRWRPPGPASEESIHHRHGPLQY